MRTFTRLAFVALVAGVLFSSCKEDEQLVLATMSAEIDGQAWQSTPAAAAAYEYSEYMTVAGYNLDGQYILISIRGNQPGEYSFEPLEAQTETYAIFMEDKDAAESELDKKKYLAVSGKVVVSSISDGKISGTFNFVAKNDLETTTTISNGKFSNVPVLGGSDGSE